MYIIPLDLPEFNKNILKINQIYTEVNKYLPEISQNIVKINQTYSEVNKYLPEIYQNLLKIRHFSTK